MFQPKLTELGTITWNHRGRCHGWTSSRPITKVKQPQSGSIHRWVTIQWKFAIHEKPSVSEIQNRSTSGSRKMVINRLWQDYAKFRSYLNFLKPMMSNNSILFNISINCFFKLSVASSWQESPAKRSTNFRCQEGLLDPWRKTWLRQGRDCLYQGRWSHRHEYRNQIGEYATYLRTFKTLER